MLEAMQLDFVRAARLEHFETTNCSSNYVLLELSFFFKKVGRRDGRHKTIKGQTKKKLNDLFSRYITADTAVFQNACIKNASDLERILDEARYMFIANVIKIVPCFAELYEEGKCFVGSCATDAFETDRRRIIGCGLK